MHQKTIQGVQRQSIEWENIFLIVLFFFFRLHHGAHEILVPLPGIESVPPAVETWSPNHWTAREFLGEHFCK